MTTGRFAVDLEGAAPPALYPSGTSENERALGLEAKACQHS
jgi:hypothetical protein